IGYIAATKGWAVENSKESEWETWWRSTEDIKYVQFMAKDNLPFHTIMWPAMILGTREEWKMADQIKGFNWLNYYGGKFSTSSKRGVFLDQAIEILPADYWRYSLMSMAPESSDSAFTWELLQVRVNKDLADTLGNFVNRTLKFASTHFGSTIPEAGIPGEREQELEITCEKLIETICGFLRSMEFRKTTEALCALWTVGNQYIDERAPWKLIKENREEAALVIQTCINLIRLYAIASAPFIPFTSQKLFDALHMSESDRMSKLSDGVKLDALGAGHPFDVPPPLFRKLEDKEIEGLSQQFCG
ncbi:MAG TPA: class I tRNA ligase family protein, partial [Oculatellaceae cyanobacterium]